MTDPRRWSDEGEGEDLTRDLLLAGQARQMPEAERRAVWAGLSLALPGAPTTPGIEAAAPAAATSALSAYLTKGVIFLATLGGLSVGALQFWPRGEPAAKASASLPAPASPVTPAAPLAQAEPESPAETVEVAAPAAPLPSEAKQRVANASQLREESMAVLEARSALRSGDAGRSLTLLEQARQRFPRGALGQEREALTIEALARSGQAALARRRAEAFVRTYPRSPHVADIRRIAER